MYIENISSKLNKIELILMFFIYKILGVIHPCFKTFKTLVYLKAKTTQFLTGFDLLLSMEKAFPRYWHPCTLITLLLCIFLLNGGMEEDKMLFCIS